MNKLMALSFAAVIGMTSAISQTCAADDRYITDVIYIPLRADKDNQATVLKNGLPSGTRLKVIREEEDANKNKWTQVVTTDGMEGWIRSQNLISEPTAAIKLEALNSGPKDIVELQKQNVALKNEITTLKATHESFVKETEAMRAANNSEINMEQENQNMHREYQLLQTERDLLKAENDQLKSSDNHTQRIYGGGLILCGVILSFVLQLLGKGRRRSEWS